MLRPVVKKSPGLAKKFLADVRAAKLTFGRRVHCPFLRPYFLSPADEQRVRHVAETMAAVAERVTTGGAERQFPFRAIPFAARGRAAGADGCGTWPGEHGIAAGRVSPAGLAEVHGIQRGIAGGAGYSETLSDIFRKLPVMEEFAKRYEVHSYPLSAKLLDALMTTYVEWGGNSKRPQMAIVDWKEVPTWSEFEILQARFEAMGVPVILADPRELEFDGKQLAAKGKKIDLVYRRVLINDIVARPAECAALVKAYEAGAVCVANNFRCKIPHVKAFFAVLTDEKNAALFSAEERELIRRHVPWTRVVQDVKSDYNGKPIELLKYIRKHRKDLVLKPSDEYGGMGVTLGWETDAKKLGARD